MGNSFQDQFLKLGLVDKKQVGKAKKQKHQKKKQKVAKQQVVIDENALLAQEALEKKKRRAQKLNRQRENKLKKREDAAAIKQMVETNRLEKSESGVAYRFSDSGIINRVFVSQEVAAKLSSGQLAIVRLADQYEVVPRDIGEKISALDNKVLVVINTSSDKNDKDPDDPYAEFEVPDDLMW